MGLPSHARIVIIGGGAIGASSLYHLAKAGWTDALLLEKNELTSGSTWHAAGNVPTFSMSWSIMNMQRYSVELYQGLAAEVDYPMNYHVTGSLRLAHNRNRMMEFERACGMGRYQGMDLAICAVSDLKDRYPFLETHDLAGGLYDPADGDIDPSQLTQALAKGARDLGARIERFCPVTAIDRQNDEWVLTTPKGEVRCEIVVNAAGYRAQELGRMFIPFGGREVPMMTMSHQYLLTEEIPDLQAWSESTGHKLPLLRDVDSSYYLRQEKFGLNLGPYETNCKAHWQNANDPMPDDFSFQLYPDDLERLEWHIEDAMARVPILGTAGINKVINGPIPYTPDGNPLIGPMPGVPNAFEACVFTFGIAQAGGAGKVLAEWVTEGQTEWDMWAVDPRRFTGFVDQDYTDVKGREVYANEYAMHFPHHEWPEGRDKRLSPNHAEVIKRGGVMGAYAGWERANWFAKAGDDTGQAATHTWGRKGPGFDRVAEECAAVAQSVGVLDLPGFSRFELDGAGAADWLLGRIAGGLPKVGRMNLAYFADPRGRILTEMSVMRFGPDSFLLITAATAEWHDYEVLKSALPKGLHLRNATEASSALIVTGPQSRALFAGLSDADLTMPWLSHQRATVADRSALLARVSFAGELGWEVHATNADMPDIYAAVLAAGAKPFGMYALDSLRLEKGYRTWKGDLTSDYSLLEAGLGRFVKLDKPQDFPGKTALKSETPAKRFATLTIEAGDEDAPNMSTIWQGENVVGEVTSGGWGHRTQASIALAMLHADIKTGAELEVEIFGQWYKATVQPDGPLYDPANERLRA